jgi:hypothetical protein
MELVNITYSGEGKQPVELLPQDQQLVTSNFINASFGRTTDYMELFIYDETGVLLDQDYDAFDYYPYLLNNPQNNTFSALSLDPEKDLKSRGFSRGNLNTQYNFYTKLFNSQFGTFYWIKEISSSRTELKLASQVLSNQIIKDGFSQYQSYISTKNYYPVFYLNFGNNQLVTANNVALTEDEEGAYLLIKLYEPLPTEFDIKTQLWIVDKVAESVSFDISIQVEAESTENINSLRGPNFNVRINTKNGQTTPYYNYNNLLTSPISSSFQKLLSYYQDKSVEINVDYTNFSNFVHWSSAVERVNNFVYKLQLIESSSADLVAQQSIIGGSSSTLIVSSSIGAIQQQIDNIIQNFDPYEYFIYFNSSSFAWPKSNTTQPYSLYSVTSSVSSNFLGGVNIIPTQTTASLLWSASYYDTTNKDLLHNSIPQYLLDDQNNQPYITFIDMVGQHFDNIWIYYKDLSNRYNNTNNPDTGISLDLVGDALRNFGIQLYTNTNVSDNLYYTLFGINPDGSLLPPTGSEKITAIGGTYVTSSLTTLPAQTIQDELYKRLYHNLPYLLKTKGTERGVKALVATYGIPEEILTVREFGGSPVDQVDGIFDLNTSDYKVAIVTGSGGNVTGSLTLSSSLLSPYATIQYYQDKNRLNNTNLEIGFSPADIINTNITASQGYFDIDQLIGAPGLQYSSSYTPLVSASNAYFASYTEPNSIWEYIRLLKFYNNSLFKTIKDFVPARANVSTGIIVKSHLYERNKYARHEPSASFQDYSQSIDMLTITASDGGAVSGSTYWDGFVVTPLGMASYTSSQGEERYTGEFSGSNIVVTTGRAFDQDEWSSLPGTGSGFIEVSLGALYQNVTESVKSQTLLDLDYNSDQLIPVNYGIVTKSINDSQINNFLTYTNDNNPYAQVQDYNYSAMSLTIPRYEGSKTISAEYNVYSPGDDSYGTTAAIDKIKYQYAYLVDIYTASFHLPARSNAQIKYIIDNDENVLDLTKLNKNIFYTQNIFRSGEVINVSLFNYDNTNKDVQFLTNNSSMSIYEGGFRYSPVLFNILGSNSIIYNLINPVITESTTGGTAQSGIVNAAGGGSYISIGGVSITDTVQTVGNEQLIDFKLNATINRTGDLLTTYAANDILVYLQWTGSAQLSVSTYFDTGLSTYPFRINSYDTDAIPSLWTGGGEPSFSNEVPLFGVTLDVQRSGFVIIPANTNSVQFQGSFYFVSRLTDFNPPSYAFNGPGIIVGTATTDLRDEPVGSGVSPAAVVQQASTTTVNTAYTTQVTDPVGSLYVLSDGETVRFSPTQSLYYNNFIISSSYSSMDAPVFPFSVAQGDMIKLSSSIGGWLEEEEYRVVDSYSGTEGSPAILYYYAKLDKKVNLNSLDGATEYPATASKYIVNKHLPDETNVILRYNPLDVITQDGILFPQYIDPEVRDNSGNVIKSLKQQNLLSSGQNTIIFD